jgi:hypothetical protein
MPEVAAETGYNRAILASYARQAGITLRKGADAIAIDRDWLHAQYVLGKRSTASIGAELGASDGTIARNLRQHGLPMRPSGVYSASLWQRSCRGSGHLALARTSGHRQHRVTSLRGHWLS